MSGCRRVLTTPASAHGRPEKELAYRIVLMRAPAGTADDKHDSGDTRARRYREQAVAVRDRAATVKDDHIRTQLHSIAADYELLAEYIENLPRRP